MKHFESREIHEAIEYAGAGGQALHTHQIIVNRLKAPACFRREVDAGRDIAHLFDQDRHRLVATARKLGVRVILVEREGRPSQHVDLCGAPLKRALAMSVSDDDLSETLTCKACGDGGFLLWELSHGICDKCEDRGIDPEDDS